MAIGLAKSVGQDGDNNREDVRVVQTLLDGVDISNGGPTPKLIVDGLNGGKTVTAIKSFQSFHKLTSTGRIEPADASLSKLIKESSYVAETKLKSSVGETATGGNQKSDVLKVQILLNAVPVGPGQTKTKLVADGLIGPNTIAAIKSFQKAQAISPIDGLVVSNSPTLAKLNEHADLTLAAHLALRILDSSGITLTTSHLSKVDDDATVYQNIADTANGAQARRSNYGNAPGGEVRLLLPILNLILVLGEAYTYSITEIVGGSHSENSRHYAGIALDVGSLNGSKVSKDNSDVKKFGQACKDVGCNEVLGPGDDGHDGHVHAALPRS